MPALLLAVPAEVIVSLVLLVILYAFRATIAKALAWALSQIPVIGGQLGGFLTDGVDQVVSWAESLAKHSLDAVIQIIAAPVQWISSVIAGAVSLVEGIVSNLQTLFSLAVSLAQSIAANTQLLLDRIATVAAHLASAIASVPGIAADVARALVNAAVETLRQAIAAVQAALTAAIAAETHLIAAVKGDLLAFIAGQVGVVTASLTALVGSLGQQLAHDVQAIDGEIGKVWATVDPLTGVLPLVGAVPIILELVNIAEDCIIPQCNILGKTLPILGVLGDLATLGIVGALVAEAVANPEEAARITAGAIADVEGAAHELFSLFVQAPAA